MKFYSLIFCMAVLTLNGCTAFNAFPTAARAGDTVALAVGSPDGMSRSNTTATFTSAAAPGDIIDVTPNIRSIFKLYADKTSPQYALNSITKNIVDTSGHEPWITIVALDLPSTNTAGAPLPTGPGTIQFTTTAPYPSIGSHINNFPIGIEILPGGPVPQNPFTYEIGLGASLNGDLKTLEPRPHTVVLPPFVQGTNPYPVYGAIEMKLVIPTSVGISLKDRGIQVVLDNMAMVSASKSTLTSSLSNGQDLSVLLVSASGTMQYYEPRFSIVLNAGNSFLAPPTITSVRYFDANGNETTGPAVSDYALEVR